MRGRRTVNFLLLSVVYATPNLVGKSTRTKNTSLMCLYNRFGEDGLINRGERMQNLVKFGQNNAKKDRFP